MNIGELWVTLGVDAAGLNAGTTAMTKFQSSVEAIMTASSVSINGFSREAVIAISKVTAAMERARMAAKDYSANLGLAAVVPMSGKEQFMNMGAQAQYYEALKQMEGTTASTMSKIAGTIQGSMTMSAAAINKVTAATEKYRMSAVSAAKATQYTAVSPSLMKTTSASESFLNISARAPYVAALAEMEAATKVAMAKIGQETTAAMTMSAAAINKTTAAMIEYQRFAAKTASTSMYTAQAPGMQKTSGVKDSLLEMSASAPYAAALATMQSATTRAMNGISQSVSAGMANVAGSMKRTSGAMDNFKNMSKGAMDPKDVVNYANTTKANLRSVTEQLERTSNQFQRFGSAASRYLTLPIALVGAVSIKAAADLEFVSEKIIALANISEEQMAAWQANINTLSVQTAISAKAIAETLYYVASAGIRSKEAMDIATIAAKAQASGMGKVDDVARMLTYAINAYGKENLSASQAADALTVAIREGTAEAGSLVAVIGDVIPVASTMGVSFDQVVGSLAAMTRTGFNAHKAATALRQIMVSMLNPTTEAENAMKMWSKQLNDSTISADGFRKIIKDEGLIEALMKVDTLTNTFGESASGIVFGNVRALTGHLSLVGKNLQENLEILRKTKEETGAFELVFERMSKTATFKLNEVKNAVNQAFLGLGQALLPTILPVLEGLVDMLKDLTNWFKNLSESSKETIAKLSLFLVAIGPVAMAIAGLIKIFSGLRVVVLALGSTFQWLGAVLASNPWVAAAVGIAAVSYALYSMADATDDVSASQKVLTDINHEAYMSIIDERVAIEQLMRMAQSELADKSMKEAAIKKLNAISPEYLGFINEETIRTGAASDAIDRYLGKLQEKARLQAAQEELVSIEKKRIQLVTDPGSIDMSWSNQVNGFLRGQTAKEKMQKAYAVLEMARLNEQKKTIQEIIDGTTNQIAQTNKQIAQAKEFRLVLNGIGDPLIAFDSMWKTYGDSVLPETYSTAIEGIVDGWKTATFSALEYQTVISDMQEYTQPKFTKGQLLSEWLDAEKARKLAEAASKEAETAIKAAAWEALSLEDKLKKLIDLMKEAHSTELTRLASQYAALDRVKRKQQELIDLELVRANFKLESNDYKVNTTYTTTGTPEKAPPKLQMQLDIKMLKLYTDWMDKLTAAGNYAGKEVNDLANKIIDLNAVMTENKYADNLAAIGQQSYLLGGSLVVTEKQIQETEKAITDLLSLYDEALDAAKESGDYTLANQLSQSIALKRSSVESLNLKKASQELNKSLSIIALTQQLLGGVYDGTSAKLQEQYTYLDKLIAVQVEAERVGKDYADVLKEIGKVSQTIQTLELAYSYEKLSYALMDADNKAMLYGNTYDRITPKLNAYTKRIDEIEVALNNVNTPLALQIQLMKEEEDILGKVKGLELDKITKQYTDALSDNNAELAVQGGLFNKRLADIDAVIDKEKAVLKTMTSGTAEYIKQIALLESLGQARDLAASFSPENILNGLIDITGQLFAMSNVTNMVKIQMSGLIKVMEAMATKNPFGIIMAAVGTVISIIAERRAQEEEYQALLEEGRKAQQAYVNEMIVLQSEYNNVLNEQIKIQSNQTFFIKDYAGQAVLANKALQDAQLTYKNFLDTVGNNSILIGGYFGPLIGEAKELTLALGNLFAPVRIREDGSVQMGSLLGMYPELIDANGKFNSTLAQTLLNISEMPDATKTALQAMINYSTQVEVNIRELNTSIENLVGGLSGSVFSSISTAWANGTDAFIAFKSAVSLGLQQIVEQMMFNAVFAESFTTLQTGITKAITTGGDITDPFKVFLDSAPTLLKYLEQIRGTWKDLATAKGFDFTQETTGTTTSIFDAQSIAQTIFDGIDNGFKLAANSLGDFAQGFGTLLKTTLMKSIETAMEAKLNAGFITKLQEFMATDSAGGATLTAGELAQLEVLYAEAIKSGIASTEALRPILDKYKIDNTSAQMTKAVQGMTVEQAGLIAGQFTAMRYDLKDHTTHLAKIASSTTESNGLMFSSLSKLTDIADNTKRSADTLSEVKTEIQKTNVLIAAL